MLTREETIKAFECCYMTFNCKGCPLSKQGECHVGNSGNPEINKAVMHYLKENEPAPAATGTSPEVSKDTSSTHLDDSILLNICQEGLCTVAQTRNADYQIGYADAVLDVIKKLRGGDNNV